MTEWILEFESEAETQALARDLAMIARPNDLIALYGDLGAGKSAFARHFIRASLNDADYEVPSPTFTLMQVYETPRFPIVHADLYRIKSSDELHDLGWDEAGDGAVVLVEWADRLGAGLLNDCLSLTLSIRPLKGPTARRLIIKAPAEWAERITRMMKARTFLENTGWGEAARTYMQGDASSRTYERLTMPRHKAVFMNAPKKAEGLVIRNGKTYADFAHLAQDMVPFVAMSEGLRGAGLSAPLVEAADLEEGFLILEDLGFEGVVKDQAPILERYAAAIDVLAELHSRPRSKSLPSQKKPYLIPEYDLVAMQIEVELMLDWYVPMKGGIVPASEKWAFIDAWTPLLSEQAALKETWVLRDFHSPNLIWLSEREGLERIGLIDFQDAMIGPASYDLVSLTQDARINITSEVESKLLAYYVIKREERDKSFNRASFTQSYAIMGAQRAAKILGIFARLNKRDGKPIYLKHLPRIYDYLYRNLQHPSLSQVKRWCDARLPAPI